MARLADYAKGSGDNKYSRYVWVMESMFDEILDEFGANDDELIAGWFEQFGKIIEWCGSGDDSVLPEAVAPYLRAKVAERLAITAGSSD
jgi:hypothetical protein